MLTGPRRYLAKLRGTQRGYGVGREREKGRKGKGKGMEERGV